MSKVSGIWRVVGISVGVFLIAYAVAYAPSGDEATSVLFDVIRKWGGVRLHALLAAGIGVAVLVTMWTRAALIGAMLAVMFSGWSLAALWLGYRAAGFGFLGPLAFALVGFLATVLAWFAPLYAWSPVPRRWRPQV